MIEMPQLYCEAKFLTERDWDGYLRRQAASALYLATLYRDWVKEEPRVVLTGIFLHLVGLHERQAKESRQDVEPRRSWYLDELYDRMGVKSHPSDVLRLAIHAVMYQRGLYRYRKMLMVTDPRDNYFPWDVWARDAELNVGLCLGALSVLAPDDADEILTEVAQVEKGIMQEIEDRKR
jgi:hypothetical protein